jgi:hypothetical protein
MLCLTPCPTRVADVRRWSVSGRQHVIMCLVCGWLEHLVPEFNSQKLKQLKDMASNSGSQKGPNHLAKAVR